MNGFVAIGLLLAGAVLGDLMMAPLSPLERWRRWRSRRHSNGVEP